MDGSIRTGSLLLLALISSACAVRRPYTAPEVAPPILQNASTDVADTSRFDPALVGAVPGSGARRARCGRARGQHRRAAGRRPTRAGARLLGRSGPRPLPHCPGRCQRGSPGPTDSGILVRASQHHRLSCRLRRVLGARPVRSRPLADAGRRRERRQSRGLARRCQGECRRGGRAQLLRAPRAAAAARRAGAEPHEPAGEPEAHDRTARCGHWRGAGCCQCRRPSGRHRGRRSASAIGAGATRASTGDAHWRAPRSPRSRPVATRLSSADACARRRTARGYPAAPAGRPRPRSVNSPRPPRSKASRPRTCIRA